MGNFKSKYTGSQVEELLDKINSLDTKLFKVVNSLPSQPETGNEDKIHLVKMEDSEEGNLFSEYIWVENKWELIGTIKINLDDYYTIEQVQEYIESLLYDSQNTNGYDYVDMGEAGIWAIANVGANSPEQPGIVVAYGETTEKDEYNTSNWKAKGKYTIGEYLLPEDDAAHVNMGGDWKTPSADDYKLLISLCNYQWIDDYNNTGIYGVLLTLKSDSTKKLFFPCVDKNINSKVRWDTNNYCEYLGSKYIYDAYGDNMYFNKNSMGAGNSGYYHNDAYPVRAFIPAKSLKYITKQEVKETFATKEDLNAYVLKEENKVNTLTLKVSNITNDSATVSCAQSTTEMSNIIKKFRNLEKFIIKGEFLGLGSSTLYAYTNNYAYYDWNYGTISEVSLYVKFVLNDNKIMELIMQSSTSGFVCKEFKYYSLV